MAANKAFAVAELILGILVILVSLLWCYVIPYWDVTSSWSLTQLYWIIIALGAVIAIVATVALAKN